MNSSLAISRLESALKKQLFSIDEDYVRNLISIGWSEEEAQRFAAWDWPHGIGTYGLFKVYKSSGNVDILDYLETWYSERIRFGLPGKNVNTVAPLYALTYIHELRPHAEYEQTMHEWADWILDGMKKTLYGGIQHKHAENDNSEELWDDTLFMTVLFLYRAGMLFDNDEYIEEAKYQCLIHQKYLAENRTGLWYHAWSFSRRDNFAGALWGRGNCWITVFIPELIELIEKEDSFTRYLKLLLQEQVKAIADFQDDGGLWHTLINDKTSYIETSASAGFVYGVLKGIETGIIDSSFKEICRKAYPALLDEINDDGSVNNVSYGTNVGYTLDHYREIPLRQMPYGQSLMLLALVECGNAIKEGLLEQ